MTSCHQALCIKIILQDTLQKIGPTGLLIFIFYLLFCTVLALNEGVGSINTSRGSASAVINQEIGICGGLKDEEN